MRFRVLTVLLCLSINIFAQSGRVEVRNAASVVEFIEQNTAKYKSFGGSFVYKKNNRTQQGSILYAAPDKLSMTFVNSTAKIVSDGKFVWISDGNLIGRQNLESSTSPINVWNIRRLVAQYTATSAPDGLNVMYGTVPAYRIIFEPKANTTSFRRIELIAERDSGLIRQISGTSRVGIKTELAVNYREFNKNYNDTNFTVEVTEDSQIFDNIF
ncbi:MAG: LolA family protein [Brevinema sp.]